MKFLFEKMDTEGLWKFIVEHRKDVTALRAELPSALESTIDPTWLVLQALEGFYDKGSGKMEKKDSGLADQRRACSLLLESLLPLLEDPIMGAEWPVVSPSTKERARVIANEWNSRIDVDADQLIGPHTLLLWSIEAVGNPIRSEYGKYLIFH